jgi:hypothetical protein
MERLLYSTFVRDARGFTLWVIYLKKPVFVGVYYRRIKQSPSGIRM